jgi:hypothetical protein
MRDFSEQNQVMRVQICWERITHEVINGYRILVCKSGEKVQFRGPRLGWGDDIKMYLKEIE